MKMDSPTIQIRDLGLAAALVSCGFEMRETTRGATGRTYFIFAQTDELGHAVNDYWADTLDVKARKFFDDIKMLKSRIYSER
jgi:hypothetical protein